VKASNSCAETLIFSSIFFIAFLSSFFPAPFRFFDLAFYCLFSFSDLAFLIPFVFPLLFRSCFVPVFFFAHVVSSLAYLNLLRNKRLGCCCCIQSLAQVGASRS
jgi:hypothetical protein